MESVLSLQFRCGIREGVVQKHVPTRVLAASEGYASVPFILKVVPAHIALVAEKPRLPRQGNVVYADRPRVTHQIHSSLIHIQRIRHSSPKLYALAVCHELVSPTRVKRR